MFRRKTVRINIFLGGIKNSAKIGPKTTVQAHFREKWVKKGYFFGQNSKFETVFTFFQKNRVVSWKDSSSKHISGRNKKFGQNRPKKKKGQAHFGKKWVKIGKKRGTFLGKTPFSSPFLHLFQKD